MIKSLFDKISYWFRCDPDVAPATIDEQAITFSSSSKKIYNVFFKTIFACTFLSMLGVILYYVYAFAAMYRGSSDFDWLLGIFSDFVVIMNFSLEESPYIVGDSSYPPFAIAMLYPFAYLCKDIFSRFEYSQLTADELTAEVIRFPEFWVSIILFFVICSSLIVFLLSKLYSLRGKDTLKLGVIVIMSAPFIYAIMRGNTIYFALIFSILFLWLRKSKNPIAREISYISLAFAGAIKIYPLFFGVFLLKDKKIFASLRVAIYSVLIFVMSFFMFRDNFEHLSPFVNNLGGFMNDEVRLLGANNLSISAQLYKLLHLFIPRLDAESLIFSIISLAAMLLVFLVSTYTAIATKNDFSRHIICFSVVMLIPSISYFYVIIFASLPFLEFIKRYDTLSLNKRIFYFLSFMFLFLSPLILAKNFIVHSAIILAFLIVETVSVIKERVEPRNQRSAKQEA